mmetsp:Transcript_24726/g.52448  ORF Transcript_24726/g.52448 Transcript_24726/m.52448 type:complete len:232 (-) Transcript_24726:395-1090(-)
MEFQCCWSQVSLACSAAASFSLQRRVLLSPTAARNSDSYSAIASLPPMATSANFCRAAASLRSRASFSSSSPKGKEEARSKAEAENALSPSSTARLHSCCATCCQVVPRSGTAPVLMTSTCDSNNARKAPPVATSPVRERRALHSRKTLSRSSRTCFANCGRKSSRAKSPRLCNCSSSSTGLTKVTQSRIGNNSRIFSRASRCSVHLARVSASSSGGRAVATNLPNACSKY